MAKGKWSSSSSWNTSYTATQNANGSVTYTWANGNSITINSNWSYSYTWANWQSWSWRISGWSSAASSFNSTYWSTWGWTISNWTLTANPSSSSSSSWWGWGWWGWGWSSIASSSPRYTCCAADWWAYDGNGNCVWHWDIVVWWATTTPGGWWGWSNNNNNNNNNCTFPQNDTPTNNQHNYPDYGSCFSSMNDYINNLQNSVTWDISWLRSLMQENATMFQSKLDAQLQAQRELENKFNQEWSKIEWKMDENTRAQKNRLDQMEQKYMENLQKTQTMLEEYYSQTREVLERRAASATASAASDVSGKWIDSAVVANTAEGARLAWQEAIRQQLQDAAKSLQELNDAYASFTQDLVNSHSQLDTAQINLLKEWLNKKQELWNTATQYVQDYVNNVYKPAEDYYNNMTGVYNSEAKTRYEKEREVAEYKAMDADARAKTIFDRLVSIVWDGWDMSTLSQWDLDLIKQVAQRDDINSVAEACAIIIKWTAGNSNSDIAKAVSSASSNWTLNINGTPSSYTKWWWSKLDYNDDSDNRLTEISNNVKNYKNTNPELFKDRNKYNEFFHYSERWETQKALLDYLWDSLKTTTNTSNSSTKLYHLDPEKWDDFKTSMWKIKNSWDTNKWKMQQVDKYIEELQHDIQVIKSQWSGPWLQNTVALYEKEIENANAYRKELKNNNMMDLALSTDVWNWKTFEEYNNLMKEVYNNSKMSASKKLEQYKRILTWATTMKKNYAASTTDNNYEKTQKLINYQKMIDECNKYIKMYSK